MSQETGILDEKWNPFWIESDVGLDPSAWSKRTSPSQWDVQSWTLLNRQGPESSEKTVLEMGYSFDLTPSNSESCKTRTSKTGFSPSLPLVWTKKVGVDRFYLEDIVPRSLPTLYGDHWTEKGLLRYRGLTFDLSLPWRQKIRTHLTGPVLKTL